MQSSRRLYNRRKKNGSGGRTERFKRPEKKRNFGMLWNMPNHWATCRKMRNIIKLAKNKENWKNELKNRTNFTIFQTVKGGGGEMIEIGSKVVVQKEGPTETKNYVIVGSEEADMAAGKISNHSPFGEALFGKKKRG